MGSAAGGGFWVKKNASKNCFLTGKNLEQVQAQGPQGGTGGKKGAGKG